MTEPYFKRIGVRDVDKIDLKHWKRAVEEGYYGHKVEDLIMDVAQGVLQLWRGRGEGFEVILLTQMFKHPAGKELKIWSLAGKGYVKNLGLIHDTLVEYAKEQGCRWLSGETKSRGFDRVYERFNPDLTSKFFLKEI